MSKRTIELTHEQIDLITQALGIAEGMFSDTHKKVINDLIRVRGNNSVKEQESISNYYHVKSCEFANLNDDLRNGNFDV
ncbi:MAG TPA: hypothetical protein PLY79_10925 [Ferruginibacter sp.]|nr:hypothetical protein [Ferruginibacter sp.]